MSEPIYRYRAVKPFEEEQSALFFGRKAETAQLAALIFAEKLTVLYGKSGYGKSSLLNAGILPLLKTENAQGPRRYVPVPVRFQNAEKGGEGLFDKFRFHFGQATKKADLTASQPLTTLPDTLWGLFKSVEVAENTTFVLLFDQFEEFFSYPSEQQAAFKEQLSELLYTAYPAFVREQRSRLSESDLEWLSASLDVRAVFAIRADRLSDLDQLSKPLAAILKNRMELGALDAEQAELAIVEPARLPNAEGRFRTGPFVYQDAALRRILAALKGAESQRIESFVLQIVCFSIEKTAERQGLTEISPDNLPDFREVFDTYYREQLAELPDDQRDTAAQVLEYGLLYYDPATSSAHRRSVDSAELQAAPTLLEALERTYLVRREVNSFGRFSYEISHDTLIEPILKARKEKDAAAEELRKEQERLEAEARAQEAEERVKHETALRQSAERQRRWATLWAWGAGLAAVAAALVAFWAFGLKNKAEQLTQLSETQKQEIGEKVEALTQKEQALTQSLTAAQLAKDTAEMRRVEAVLAEVRATAALAKLKQETDPKSKIFQEALRDWERRNNYILKGDEWRWKLDGLDLSSKGLLTLPQEVYQCKGLKALYLYGNPGLVLSEVLPNLGNLKSLSKISLGFNQLTSLPIEIAELKNLKTLNLTQNQLNTLPLHIVELKSLETLDLNGNQLTALPDRIIELQNLTTLDLSFNSLSAFPAQITKLKSLVILDLTGNRLTSLPAQIADLKNLTNLYLGFNKELILDDVLANLSTLKNLSALDLNGNDLTSLPTQIIELENLTSLDLNSNPELILSVELIKLSNLKKLTSLNLASNQIDILPIQIRELQSLKKLDLAFNPRLIIGDAFVKLGTLKNLTELNLMNNQLINLPPQISDLKALTELDLRNNQLSSLPPQVGELKKLSKLYLRNNPIPQSEQEKIKQLLPNCKVYF